MGKHTQTIRQQKPTSCLNVFDHFVGLLLKGLVSEVPRFYFIYLFSIYLTLGIKIYS